MVQVKICGIKTPEILEVTAEAGADFAGFVFYPKSPRFVETEQAVALVSRLPSYVKSVGLFVNPEDGQIADVLRLTKLEMIQLHGDESPERVGQVRKIFSLPVIKAIPVSSEDDFVQVQAYEDATDWLLFDRKSDAYGGTGQSFDWNLLRNKTFKKPWMLSGGLTADNVAEALSLLFPTAVDVSSGVESARGVKDADKIRAFIAAAKAV